ncbi:MAG: aminoglycoside phosphotransferase family protein [Actinomycetes bacterium]
MDDQTVRRLLQAQFPDLARLPRSRVLDFGTDHVLYRLGDSSVARLPRIAWADGQAALEAEWLPRLAPHLPLQVSPPLALGSPDAQYPFSWSVNPWLAGEKLDPHAVDRTRLALDLAGFVHALQSCDPTGARLFGSRGQPLDDQDRGHATREALRAASDLIDAPAALAVWEAAQESDPWGGPPTWFHGDLTDGNLLVRDGQLSAVLDWGPFGVGDPACELAAAWLLFDTPSRTVFREALGCDDATWQRGRGWAVSIGAILIPYYRDSVPALARRGILMIEAALAQR